MQVLDQQVAPARRLTEKRLYFSERRGIDLPTFGGTAHLAGIHVGKSRVVCSLLRQIGLLLLAQPQTVAGWQAGQRYSGTAAARRGELLALPGLLVTRRNAILCFGE